MKFYMQTYFSVCVQPGACTIFLRILLHLQQQQQQHNIIKCIVPFMKIVGSQKAATKKNKI